VRSSPARTSPAVLFGVNLEGADLTDADLTDARWAENEDPPSGWVRDLESGRLKSANASEATTN
jgi:uncharacterized protein YjbI with pentapeptide repeats